MQCTSYHNFLHKKNPYLHALQGNGEMGARYLDPKYSRWISVDPALGEYVPGAGKTNTKDAGGLPGMGGLFNSVNLSLFHYAGNNPVKYADPDGRELIIYGDLSYKQTVADYLRHLAPGASVDLKTGKVYFDESENRGWHIKGSELIEKLVNNGATVIQQEKGNDKASKTISNEAGSVWVIFNPDFRRDIPTVLSNRDGKTLYVEIAKPIMILGHELIHALHYTEGTIDDSTVDFYINLFGVAGQTKNIKKEELRTVGIPGYYSTNDITENMLRSELSFLLRADYD